MVSSLQEDEVHVETSQENHTGPRYGVIAWVHDHFVCKQTGPLCNWEEKIAIAFCKNHLSYSLEFN